MNFAKCATKGCPAPAAVKGLCLACYQADRLGKLVGKCKKERCEETVYCRGLCRPHYLEERNRRMACSGQHCSVCHSNKIYSRGLCIRCYEVDRRKGKGICVIARCHEKAGAGGLCAQHQKRVESRRQKKEGV